ncbi:DMT family transporter [Salimicrobium halophilum]|uniref:Threonine/homoserine efflux transporter RhtA n=1 Tax=Salimicrobium halophilum TaxID=86666 RepID=A0A1G8VRF7_9BACI|nr:EamA family transporter [Salimicrobium halophilum]SDJ68678.1 Threonine/homoserine efflux transporter RhtA [Salimicrobium halophilum]
MSQKLSMLSIAFGAALWGIIGLFVTYLYDLGFSPVQVVAVRVASAAILLLLYTYITGKEELRIDWKDSRLFIGTGIISIVFFNLCLFIAMEETSIAIAVTLLYTAPAFVTIFSRILFGELFTKSKITALLTTFIGCALVVGLLPYTGFDLSMYGVLAGLGSGFFYALYSIFATYALRTYSSTTVTVYTFVFASVAILPFAGLGDLGATLALPSAWINIAGIGLFSTTLAFLFYTKGLEKIESSRASIIATVEPVVAALISFFVFGELLDAWQFLGFILVITAVILVQERPRSSFLRRKAS